MTAPERSGEQRRLALDIANHVRTNRARLKADLKAGRADVAAIVEDPPAWAKTMRTGELLLAVPGVGKAAVWKLFRFAEISPSRSLGALSDRQRQELVLALRARRRSGWLRDAA